jgi:hypothetical protein
VSNERMVTEMTETQERGTKAILIEDADPRVFLSSIEAYSNNVMQAGRRVVSCNYARTSKVCVTTGKAGDSISSDEVTALYSCLIITAPMPTLVQPRPGLVA